MSLPQSHTTDSASPLDSKARREMIEASGTLFQMLGFPRSAGQVYGLLYLSAKPLSLDDICNLLLISKGSASTGTRHLASWGAVRQVWVPGNRRDHFEVVGDPAQLLRASYAEFLKPRLSGAEKRLSQLFKDLEQDLERGLLSQEDFNLCSERLQALLRVQENVRTIGPMAEKLLLG